MKTLLPNSANRKFAVSIFRQTFETVFILMLFSFFIVTKTKAQVSGYSFLSAAGTYNALSSPVNIHTGVWNDAISSTITLPFTFNYNGTNYTQIKVNTNGTIYFGNTVITTTNYNAISGNPTPANTGSFSVLGCDLMGASSGLGNISYQVLGVSPNRKFVVQWMNCRIFSGTQSWNFQAVLNETSNVLQAVYGTFTTPVAATAQVGLRGATNMDFNNRTTNTSWAASVAGTLNTNTVTIGTSNIPASGLTWTWTPGTTCSGTPTAGTITGPSGGVCSAMPFNITNTGYTTGASGLTFQWQYQAVCGGAWSNIAGQTAPGGGTFSQTASGCYRLFVVCTASGLNAVSNTVTVSMSSANNCYPLLYASASDNEEISNTTIIGSTTLNQNSTCATLAPGPGSILKQYSNYHGFATVPDLSVNAVINFSLTQTTCTGSFPNGFKIWIDYNQNGVFTDPGEGVYSQPVYASGNHTKTGFFIVPATAILGNTGLRVCVIEDAFPNTTNYGASVGYTFGETEDYLCNITVAAPCSGTPLAGTATVTPSLNICPVDCIQLTATGLSSGSGIIYSWQYNSGGGWNDLPGTMTICGGLANSPAVSVSNQTTATSYRILTICTNGGGSNISNAVATTQSAIANCYCASSASSNTSSEIFNVSIGTLNNSSVCGTLAPGVGSVVGQYSNYKTLAATNLNITGNYSISLFLGQCGGPAMNAMAKVYIDYNVDGDFNDVGEDVFSTAYGLNSVTGLIATGTIIISPMATAGNTVMRVVFSESATVNPCGNYSAGETEDYKLNLISLPACSGVPVGGTTNSSDPSPCIDVPFTLSVNGATSGASGLTYQWQVATTCAGPWTNLGTTLNQDYTFCATGTKVFRRAITCGASTSYSSCLSLTASLCYCMPTYTSGTGTGFFISRVKIDNGNLDNASGASSSPYYTNYSSTCSGTTVPAASMMVGAPYWINVSTGTNAAPHVNAVWIDFNNDGDFIDAGELWGGGTLQILGGGATSHHFGYVPNGAIIGYTSMRVRTSSSLVSLDPCLSTSPNYINGETEDYLVNIIPCVCTNPTQNCPITVNPTQTVANDYISVSSSCSSTIVGYEIDWDLSNGLFTPANNTLSPQYDSTGFIANINPGVPQGFIYIRAKYQNGCCPASYSNAVAVTIDCAPSISSGSSTDYISNIKLGTAGSIINNSSTYNSNGSSYQNFLSQGPYAVGRGTAIPFQVCTSPLFAEGVRVWIDENGDGAFATTESYYSDIPSVGCHPWGTITIPQGSGYVGLAKMRVMCQYPTTPNVDPCFGSISGAVGWGEIEEYMVDIQGCPPITVNPSSSICQGQTAVLTGTGPGVVTNWQWTPTNGVNGVVMSPANGSAAYVTVTSTNPTSVFFTVTGTLASGCVGSNTVEVSTIPVAPVVTPASSIVCSGGIKLLTATGASGTSQWQFSNDNITWVDIAGATTGSSYTTAPATTTKYYRLKCSGYCLTIYSNTAIIEIASTPIITFTNGSSSCVTVNWVPAGGGSYTINWTGAATGSSASVTPPYTICGLGTGTLNVTVVLTNPAACGGVNPGTASYAIPCVAPAAPTTSNITSSSFTLNWLGSGTFKVFFRPIITSNYSSVVVTGNSYTVTGALSNMLYQCYIQKQNCPSTGTNSAPSPTISFYTLPGASACPVPTPFASAQVTANCGNTITVSLSGNPSNNYIVYFQRTCPPPPVTYFYNVTGTTFNFNAPAFYTGSCWNVFAQSSCGGTNSLFTNMVAVTTQATCPAPNPAYGQITCIGFTVMWPQVMCGSSPATNYKVFIREVGTTVWVNYNAPNMIKVFTNLLPGHSYDVFVRAFGCNNAQGIASSIQTVSTLPVSVCRMEDTETDETIISNDSEPDDEIIFPNPADHFFSVVKNFNNETLNEDCVIFLTDLLGQTVLIQPAQIENGLLKTIVDLPEEIASGIYLVEVRSSVSRSVQRVVISK